MSFVLQTVAGILRDSSGSSMRHSVANNDVTGNGCSCNKHPSRCCHKADFYAAFSNSFESMHDDLND